MPSNSPGPDANSRRGLVTAVPPWQILTVLCLVTVALVAINWPASRGPAADRRVNQAIRQAAGSFAPEAMAQVVQLDLHRLKVRSFAGLEALPNLEIIYIHPDSVPYWRDWADGQLPDADPLTPDVRPTLPLLPRLRTVQVGPPGG